MDPFATSFDFLYLDLYLEALFGRPGYSPPFSVSIIALQRSLLLISTEGSLRIVRTDDH